MPFYTQSIGDRPLLFDNGLPDADSLPHDESIQLWYNEFEFGPLTRMTGYKVTPKLDESRRHVVYNEFQMTVRSQFACEGREDADLLADQIRRALSVNGAELYINGRTVGEMWVNSYNPLLPIDVMNGPICTGLEFEVIGGGVTGAFTFNITWCLPDCDDAVYTADLGILEWNYTVDTDVDGGYTTRTISGHLVIPQNRADYGVRFSADAADRFKDDIDRKHRQPPNFFRTWSFRLSSNRARLEYTITDTEMGIDSPPPGCLRAEESYEVSSTHNTVLTSWVATLSGRYEVAKYGRIQDAVNAFLETLLGKMTACEDIEWVADGKRTKTAVIPLHFSARQPDLRGRRTTELTAAWSFTGPISEVMAKSGLWKRVSNGDANEWIGTFNFENGPFKPRGNVADTLDFIIELDEFQNLCRPIETGESENPPTLPEGDTDADEEYETTEELEDLITPDADTSWIGYVAHPEFEDDDGVSAVRTLPSEELTGDTDLQGSINASDATSIADGYETTSEDDVLTGGNTPVSSLSSPTVESPPSITDQFTPPAADESTAEDPAGDTWVERRVRPQRFVYLVGGGSRYGFPIREPKLTSVKIGGETLPVIRSCRPDQGEGFRQYTVQLPSFFAVAPKPVYVAQWRIRYGIVGNVPPGPLAVLPNPVTGD